MRLILTALLCAALASGADTTVSDTIRTLAGGTFTGSVFVKGPMRSLTDGGTFHSPDGTVATEGRTVAVTNGAFSVDLPATDTMTPSGSYYLVTYRPQNAQQWTEKWIVPTSASPITVTSARVATTPTPGLSIQPSQISSGGAQPGQQLAWTGSSWAPGGGPVSAAVTAASTLTVTHNFGTPQIIATCYETGGGLLSPAVTTLDANRTMLSFGGTVTGTCAVLSAAPKAYSVPITAQTTVTITGSTHALGHAPHVACTDGTAAVDPMAAITAQYDVTLQFPAAFTGVCSLI